MGRSAPGRCGRLTAASRGQSTGAGSQEQRATWHAALSIRICATWHVVKKSDGPCIVACVQPPRRRSPCYFPLLLPPATSARM